MDQIQQRNLSGTLHSRPWQCQSRLVKLSKPSHCNRMVSTHNSENLPIVGNPGDRLVRLSSEQQSPNILLTSTRADDLAGRSIFDSTGQSSCMHFERYFYFFFSFIFFFLIPFLRRLSRFSINEIIFQKFSFVYIYITASMYLSLVIAAVL